MPGRIASRLARAFDEVDEAEVVRAINRQDVAALLDIGFESEDPVVRAAAAELAARPDADEAVLSAAGLWAVGKAGPAIR
jgi:hypothetical protein